jgi:GDP-4-dehydro-6-deoxy-D-mannose reductase
LVCVKFLLENRRGFRYLIPVPKFRRALITGIAGFAGSYLAEELVGAGYEVFGTRMRGESTKNLAGVKSQLDIRVLDIRSARGCEKLLGQIRPHMVFHLAAFSDVGASFDDPELVMQVNFGGTLHLLEALRQNKRAGKTLRVFLTVGSSDMYGRVKPSQLPLAEDQPLNPVSPYAISKTAADFLAATYHRAYGLPIIRVRAFNHAGPRQRPGFVISDMAGRIARLEGRAGRRVLKTGNLTARRDFTDVRDVARAYRLIAEKGKPGEVYHIGSGKAVSIQWVVKTLVGMARRLITIVPNAKSARPIDVPVLRADITKLNRLGWRPTIILKKTLSDTLEYHRSRV